MTRATLIVEVDQPDDMAAMEAWLARWQQNVMHCSDNLGCGCCVDIWHVDAPQEAIDHLPPAVVAGTEWT